MPDVRMVDDKGVARMIPAERVAEAQAHGGKLAPALQPTNFGPSSVDHMQQNTMARAVDKTANFVTHNAPTIAGSVGGVAGGVRGGIPGAVAGASVGGAVGGAIRSKAETGKVSGGDVLKAGAEQGAWELGGGLAGKGIGKVAKLLGVDEAIMKFALKSGEDFDRGLNPAAALNKWKLKALATRDLHQKTVQQIGSMTKTADAVLDRAAPYSSTVRPYAVIKGVIDQAKQKASRVGDASIANAMDDMLETLSKEFNTGGANSARGAAKQEFQQTVKGAANVTPVGRQAAENALKDEMAKLPTDRVMTVKEANALKQQWGESVNWAKDAPQDALQNVFKATQGVRRDVYQALNQQIADNMGGNEGKVWHSINHDVFNLMEAKSLIQKAAASHSDYGKTLGMKALDSMRNPGPASMAAAGVRGAEKVASHPAAIPTAGRVGDLGYNALFGNNGGSASQPPPQGGATNPFLVNR